LREELIVEGGVICKKLIVEGGVNSRGRSYKGKKLIVEGGVNAVEGGVNCRRRGYNFSFSPLRDFVYTSISGEFD